MREAKMNMMITIDVLRRKPEKKCDIRAMIMDWGISITKLFLAPSIIASMAAGSGPCGISGCCSSPSFAASVNTTGLLLRYSSRLKASIKKARRAETEPRGSCAAFLLRLIDRNTERLK